MSGPSALPAAPGTASAYSPLIEGAALFALFQTFSKLSPILLSFLLILLITLALNPVITRMRAGACLNHRNPDARIFRFGH